LTAVILGLLVAYLTLRRWTPPSAAFVAVIAVWAHPLLPFHTFEARFYGPFFLFAALLTYSVGIDRELARSRTRDWAIGVSSALLCTIHYFGILAWLLVFVTTLVPRRCLPVSPSTWVNAMQLAT
jgi:hypothetical protein